MQYAIRRREQAPPLTADWDHPAWAASETLDIANFHPKSSPHRPRTQARLMHDQDGIDVIFRVEDRYVRSVNTTLQGPVCRDSCVEFFVQPHGSGAYFNFEINAGGTLHVTYIRDASRRLGGFADYTIINHGLLETVPIKSTLPPVVEPEIIDPTTWCLQYHISRSFMETFCGPLGDFAGQTWRANFYKCGDATSHPHWATWSPIEDELNFHLPQYFAPIRFAS